MAKRTDSTHHTRSLALFEDYAHHPGRYWRSAPLHDRQVQKLEKAISVAAKVTEIDTETAIRRIGSLALARRANRPPPIYVMGLGGSGSHWLSRMLSQLVPAIAIGEVSVPPALLEEMDSMDRAEQGFLADCVHLAHVRTNLSDDLVTLRVINSAPRFINARYKTWDSNSFSIRLLRDPRDQVMSVTFRKQAFRGELEPNLSDEEYLLARAEDNARNYASWERSRVKPDFFCRYEDLRQSTAESLERLLTAMGLASDSLRITQVARAHNASLMRTGAVPRQGNVTRKDDRGWKYEADKRQKALLHSRLVETVASAGYPTDNCTGQVLQMTECKYERRLTFPSNSKVELATKASGDDTWRPISNDGGKVIVLAGIALKMRVREDATRGLIESLATLPPDGLDSLCLAGNTNVSDDLIAMVTVALPRLSELDLARTAISGTGVAYLTSLQQLRAVSLLCTDIPSRSVTALRDANPSLEVVA